MTKQLPWAGNTLNPRRREAARLSMLRCDYDRKMSLNQIHLSISITFPQKRPGPVFLTGPFVLVGCFVCSRLNA
jgi:hypothetical protein